MSWNDKCIYEELVILFVRSCNFDTNIPSEIMNITTGVVNALPAFIELEEEDLDIDFRSAKGFLGLESVIST
jgi:hypothetical protein